jgi:hypothetical protein
MPTHLPTAAIVLPSFEAMPVALLDWKPITKGALRGFARVRLGCALVIHDIPVLCSNGRAWATLPSKPIIGADSTVARDEKGKTRYAPILEWADRAAADRFGAAVLAAIRAEHPNALADASP